MTQHDAAAALRPLGFDDARRRELRALGWDDAAAGRVVRVDRGAVRLATGAGAVSAPAHDLAVGDWVAVADGRIVATLTRRSLMERRAAGRATAAQPLAANVDVVAIVHSCDRPLHPRRIHRATAMVWESGATPVVALTKADLAGEPEALLAALATAAPGVDAMAVAVATGAGLDRLAGLAVPDRTLCLVGESGAGKSTLVNALLGVDALATGRVRHGDHKGRHTTSARHLLALPGGGAIIDTPGIREVGLWDAGGGVDAAFADVEAHAARCRFSDCRHDGEPGCAVRAAERDGLLDPERVRSMIELRRELDATELRRDEHARRRRGRAGSLMVREALRVKGREPGGGRR